MFYEIRKHINRSFALAFLVNLMVTTLVAVAALSYVEGNGSFSPARGWRVFTSFFGGFWGMMGTLTAVVIVVAAIGYALWATETMHRIIAGILVLVVVVLATFFGQKVFNEFPVGKLVFVTIFLSIVLVETFIEARVFRNTRAATRRAVPVTHVDY